MPFQNRVDPFGAIFRTAARGTYMGNRGGALHNASQEIVRQHLGRRWITCVLEFKDRHRSVMTPGRYTELFFLDEAVAFAAGHRPCAECRRERFNAFRSAWAQRTGRLGRESIRADAIDAELHAARIDSRKRKVTYQAELGSLPDGCFAEIEGAACLLWKDALFEWSPAAYVRKRPRPDDLVVTVLTPRPIVECFVAGYRPQIHDSAVV